MFFPDLPIFDEFSFVYNSMMFLVQEIWTCFNLPLLPSDSNGFGVLDYLNAPPWVVELLSTLVNLFTWDGVSLGDYSVLTFLVTNIVFVVFIVALVKFFVK